MAFSVETVFDRQAGKGSVLQDHKVFSYLPAKEIGKHVRAACSSDGPLTVNIFFVECKMVCHGKCALAVSLTCEADQQIRSQTLTDGALSFYKTIVQETKDEVKQSFDLIAVCFFVLNTGFLLLRRNCRLFIEKLARW